MAVNSDVAAVEPPEVQTNLLNGLVGYRLRQAQNRVLADFSTSLAPIGIRPVLFAMLVVIGTNPGIIQIGLGTVLHIQRANLVPLINELTGRGLAERRPAPRDRRAFALYLTPEGEQVLDEAMARVRSHEKRMLARLSGPERETLIELLAKIAAE